MSTYWAHSRSFEFDNAGRIAIGAKAFFYVAGTSAPRATYQDADLSTPHAHPVVTDGFGRWPAVFLQYGPYKSLATTVGGTTLWSDDNIPNPAPVDAAEGVDPDSDSIFQTGDTIIGFANEGRTGFVRCNGRTIGSATSTATERANADCEDLFAYLWDKSTTLRALVSGGAGASAAADFAANKRIPLPDGRGAGLIGFDDMGNSAASLLGSAPVVSGSGILAGSILGANTHTLLTAEMATHSHALTLASAASNGAHTHTATTSSNGAHTHSVAIASGQGSHSHPAGAGRQFRTFVAAGGTLSAGAGGNDSLITDTDTATLPAMTGTADSQGAHTHTLTTSSDGAHTHTLSGTTDNGGGGGAHNNLSRSIPVTVLMKL